MIASVRKALRQRRFHVTFMVFLGCFNLYSLRVNLSVGVVAMTEGTKSGFEPEFDWNSKQQGVALSSFYYGYILTLFGGGILATWVGGRRLFGAGVFCTGILTLLTPWAARSSFGLFIFVQALKGVFGGICYPSLAAIWSKWAPPMERSRLNAIAFAGMYAGTVVMMPVSGVLGEHFGWPSIFYVTGAIACVWYVIWLAWITECPEQDRLITREERDYILEGLKHLQKQEESKRPPIPWRAIFTSGPVWAMCAANCAEDWGFYTLLTQLPTYLSDTLDLNLESTGLIAALPYIALFLATFPVSYFADWARESGFLTTTQVRKILSCTGLLAEASFLIIAILLTHPVYSILCLILAVSFGSCATSGYAVNSLDIAPRFASILSGMSNTFGTATGIISPILSGFIVQDGTQAQWNVVFGVAACLYVVSCMIYFFLGSGEEQSWAKVSQEITETEDPEIISEKIIVNR